MEDTEDQVNSKFQSCRVYQVDEENSILNMSGLAIAIDRAYSDIVHVTHAGDDGSQNNAHILLKRSIGPYEENK